MSGAIQVERRSRDREIRHVNTHLTNQLTSAAPPGDSTRGGAPGCLQGHQVNNRVKGHEEAQVGHRHIIPPLLTVTFRLVTR